MPYKVKSIDVDENASESNITFLLTDSEAGVKNITLLRAQFYDELMNEEIKGVHITVTGDSLQEETFNIVKSVNVTDDRLYIVSSFDEYHLDVSDVENSDKIAMLAQLKKQDFDHKFKLNIDVTYSNSHVESS